MKIRNDDRIAYKEGRLSELSEDVIEFLAAEAKAIEAAAKDEKKSAKSFKMPEIDAVAE